MTQATDPLRITAITLRTEGITSHATFELTDRLSDRESYELGIEYRKDGQLHQAAVRRMNGVVDASVFTSYGGSLNQVSESFDVTGNTVTLVIGRAIPAAALPDYKIRGYLEVDAVREQSDVPVVVIGS